MCQTAVQNIYEKISHAEQYLKAFLCNKGKLCLHKWFKFMQVELTENRLKYLRNNIFLKFFKK